MCYQLSIEYTREANKYFLNTGQTSAWADFTIVIFGVLCLIDIGAIGVIGVVGEPTDKRTGLVEVLAVLPMGG